MGYIGGSIGLGRPAIVTRRDHKDYIYDRVEGPPKTYTKLAEPHHPFCHIIWLCLS